MATRGGGVRAVRLFPLDVIHIVLDAADRQAQELMNASHPLGVAGSKVIVDRHNINSAAG